MSMTKWIMGVAVVLVLGAGAWWYFTQGSPKTEPSATQGTSQTQNDTNGMSAAGDTSNQALAQDTAAIDAQMQGLSSDSSAADASMNDQAVAQSY